MKKKEEFIDPLQIKKEHLPLIVFSDNSFKAVNWAIKLWTKGYYNHIMWMHRPGFFASQGGLYSEIPVEQYMVKGNRLKFVRVKHLTADNRQMVIESINKKLKLPWFRRIYDWFGIAGQIARVKNFSFPGLDYCSEDVPEHLRENTRMLKTLKNENLRRTLLAIPKHGSPEDLNNYMKQNQDVFEVFGRWDADEK